MLTTLTDDTVPSLGVYSPRAFEKIKEILVESHDHNCILLKYGTDTDPIFIITDGRATEISGVVSQGTDWKNAKIAVFYSVKLNSAQRRNYVVREIEVFACVETAPGQSAGSSISVDDGS